MGERVARAAEMGFRSVECWWPDDAGDRAALADAVRESRIGLALLNAFAGDLGQGERGRLNQPGERDAAVAAIVEAAELVHELGGGAVNLLVGRALSGPRRAEQLDTAVATVRDAAVATAHTDTVLVVEHLNSRDVPGYLLPRPADVLAFIERVDDDRVRLLYDAFHAMRMGIDPVAEVGAMAGRIGHAQYADAPGRSAPGTGDGDPWQFAAALHDCKYAGPVGLECDPRGPTGPALEPLLTAHPS